MNNTQMRFRRNKLVFAISLALAGATITGCSDDDDSIPSSGNIINANGGNGGSLSSGGDGGEFSADNEAGTGGVELLKEGKAKTAFNRPDLPTTANLGANPLLITEDTTIDDAAPIFTAISNGSIVGTGQDYIGTDSVLRIADSPVDEVTGNQIVNYTTDTIITDERLYRSNLLSNELLIATGDDSTADPAAAGTIYLRSNSYSRLYIADGDTSVNDSYYSGLSVNEGSTLTFGENYYCSTSVLFTNDIDNKGTITKTTNGCNLGLTGSSYFGNGDLLNKGTEEASSGHITITTNLGIINSGTIDTSGYSNTEGSGTSAGNIYLYASAYLLNTGSINANGGDGTGTTGEEAITGNGGDGGEIFIGETGYGGDGSEYYYQNPVYLENSGQVSASGGNNTSEDAAGSGGDGGEIRLEADAILNNTKAASLDTSGGNGTYGGDGGEIELRQAYTEIGALLNAAPISSNGGHGTTGRGGDGGEIDINTEGSQIQTGGVISAKGGDSVESSAGDGGELWLFVDNVDNYIPENGDIVVSGNIHLNGGKSTNSAGGDGGEIRAETDYYYGGDGGEFGDNNESHQRIAFLGYDSLELNGGNGGNGGHGAGYYNNGVEIDADANNSSVVNELAINAKGGDSTYSPEEAPAEEVPTETTEITELTLEKPTIKLKIPEFEFIKLIGQAGMGGYVEIDAELDITNNGAINADAGKNGTYANRGGQIEMYTDEGSVTNSGSLSSSSQEASESGNNGGYIFLEAYGGTVNNSATAKANGSDALYQGGDGGSIYIEGVDINNTAGLVVSGGNATTEPAAEGEDEVTGYGGNGGYISLETELFLTPTSTGSFSYSAGSGITENGNNGCAKVNFVLQGNCTNIDY